MAAKHLRARITNRRDFAPDLWSIRIAPEQNITFQPGQYATLGVEDLGKVWERPYSICSSPSEPELEFFFELVPHGDVTPRLYNLKEGDELFVRPACKGLFTLDRKTGHRKHFMVATVTGIAPFVSIARTLAAEPGHGHQLHVLLGASRSWEFGYAEELRALSCQHDWLRLVPTVSRIWEDPRWPGERGRVDDVVRKYADEFGASPEDTTAYLCGHPTMISNVRGILERAGFKKESIKEEIYFVLKP